MSHRAAMKIFLVEMTWVVRDERHCALCVPGEVKDGVRVDQSAAHRCGYRVDGGYALFAAAIRLSLRGRDRFKAVRDVQGDGTSASESHHQPGDDRDLAGRALPRMGRSLVFCRLVARQAPAGAVAIGCPRLFFPLREGFRA